MTHWIYCGTDKQADAAGTQRLLSTRQAIWCSPPGLRPWPRTPVAGERVWLVWRDATAEGVVLLGHGILLNAPRERYRTNLLWTNADCPGLRDEASRHGYRGPTSMSFLRLSDVTLTAHPFPRVAALGHLAGGLNVASAEQLKTLQAVHPARRDA